MSTDIGTYPVRVEGRLDPGLSRWLWLVKWLLVIPHYLVLAFLWLAFAVLSVVAFFAILFTGRYPRGIFDFNVGVLRWTWRVGFYAFGANGTDRYPPFTLAATDYPATYDVEYPGQLSRGLVLVKWWLLAIPHYIVVAFFVGGGAWAAWEAGDDAVLYGGGLVGILVFIAVVVLLFTGRYPRGIFDLVLGMNRWALRVATYAGLMTDRYPPFRLDLGGSEPGAIAIDQPPAEAPATGWTAGRVLAVVFGSLATLIAVALLAAGGATLVIDGTQRGDDGYLMTPTETLSTGTHALLSETVRTELDGPDLVYWSDFLGTLKLRSESAEPVFVGIGPAAAVDRYLAGVPLERVDDLYDERGTVFGGGATPAPPGQQDFWVATSRGAGEQALRWDVQDGSWRVVVMNVDASRGVRADMSVGARLPDLNWLGLGLLGAGALLLVGGVALLYVGVRRQSAPSIPPTQQP
jgi:Domain of unknown function (DUF4389)